MGKFYVGQRVRIVGTVHAGNSGAIGTVTTVTEFRNGPGDEVSVWTAFLDELDYFSQPAFGHRQCHIAPAYDGHEKVSWEDCAWRPSPEIA